LTCPLILGDAAKREPRSQLMRAEDIVGNWPTRANYGQQGWLVGGGGRGAVHGDDSCLTLQHQSGGFALYRNLDLPPLPDGLIYRFTSRVKADRPSGVAAAVFSIDKWSDRICGPRSNEFYDLSVNFKADGPARLHVWIENGATVAISEGRVTIEQARQETASASVELLERQPRPPYLSDEKWAEFREAFLLNPREAYSKLNELEKVLNQELCYSWPNVLQFSLTDLCNIMCRFCGQMKYAEMFKSEQYSAEDVTVAALERIFRDVEIGFPFHVDLSGDGEPLVAEGIANIFAFLRRKFPYSLLRVCSNGLALDEKMAELLVDLNVHALNISLNAATAETWLRVTGNQNFDKVISNIRYLQKYKAKMGATHPVVGMTFVATRTSVDDLPRFIELCHDVSAYAAAIHLMTVNYADQFADSLVHEKRKTNRILKQIVQMAAERNLLLTVPTPFADESNENDVPSIPNIDHPALIQDYARAFKQAKRRGTPPGRRAPINVDERPMLPVARPAQRCGYPWDYMLINGRGESRICCGDMLAEEGSIFEVGFAGMWNGNLRRYLRRTVNTERIDRNCYYCPLNKTRDIDDPKTHMRSAAQSALIAG
jgi:MoaA/NifB/PqqE/SkfB family radical SAM enzyme